MKQRMAVAAFLALWLPASVLAQAPIDVWITTDANGGVGQSTLQTGTNHVYVFASGTAGIDDFQFDPRPAPAGIEPGQALADLGAAFQGSGLTALELGAFDKFFGWSKFLDESVQITGPTILVSFQVTVLSGSTGDDAALDLAGDTFSVSVDGTRYDSVQNGNDALRIAGPASGGGGGGGGGTTDPGTTDPGTTDPGTTDPGTTDPGTTDPGTTDPGTTDPGTTDPGTTDPGTTDPGTQDPGTSSPGGSGGSSDPPVTTPPVGTGFCGPVGAVEMSVLSLALGLLGCSGCRRRQG